MKNNLHNVSIENGVLPSFDIEIGQTVIWTNKDSLPYQLNSDPNNPHFFFDIGIIFPGESSSPILINSKFGIDELIYGDGLSPNKKAKIKVIGPNPVPPSNHSGHNHEDHYSHSSSEEVHDQNDHLKHFHGFVTGGITGDRIYMTHTPIFADERHHFQIILEAQFVESKHIIAYNKLRTSEFGHGKVDLFFDHLALINIQSGKVDELDLFGLRYHTDLQTENPEIVYRGAKVFHPAFDSRKGARVRVKIKNVLHFRKFEPDMEYPESLTYLMYGNGTDVFFDYFISRAPNFHSVGKLAKVPDFWTSEMHNGVLKFQIPSRKIIEASPKQLQRVSFLDNRHHLVWGTPSGLGSALDPLAREPLNKYGNREFDVLLESGQKGRIEVSHLTHFNAAGLLNDGLGFDNE
ncbi:MAG: hypothetical protein AAF600_04685 [Bacteroidota bacterium]